MIKYKVIRDLTEQEKYHSMNDINKGDIIYRFTRHTYGCISDGGIACSKVYDDYPFFEMPINSIEEIKQNDRIKNCRD